MYNKQLYSKKIVPVKNRNFFIEIWPKIIFEAARTSVNIRATHYSVPKRGIGGYTVHTHVQYIPSG